MESTGSSVAGTDYSDDFAVTPSIATVLVSGDGCALSGTAGSYTLTASRADAGTRTCTVAAVDALSTTATATVAFSDPGAPSITGLESAGSSVAGVDYSDDFSVAPSGATVLVSGEGCALSGTAGSYTLTASRADAGTRTCTVAATHTATAVAVATVAFVAVPSPQNVVVECRWSGEFALFVRFDPIDPLGDREVLYVAEGAGPEPLTVNGYEVDGGPRREVLFSASEGTVYSLTMRARVTGVGDSQPSAAAEATCQRPPAPTGVSVVCGADRQVVVEWDPVAGSSGYKVLLTKTPPDGVGETTSEHPVAHFDVPAGQKLALPVGGTVDFTYTARAVSIAGGAESDPSEPATATCERPGGPENVSVSCGARLVVGVSWDADPDASSYSATSTGGLAPFSDSDTGFTRRGETGAQYTVTVKSLIDGIASKPSQVSAVCPETAAIDAAWDDVSGLSVSCGADGWVRARWDAAVLPSDASFVSYEVGGDFTEVITSRESPSASYEATSGATYKFRVKTWVRDLSAAPVQLRQSTWSDYARVKCPPFAPQDVRAECNNYGVIRVSWDKISTADQYRVSGPAALVGSSKQIDVPAHAGNPQSDRRAITWQKEEGDTYSNITVQARTNGEWSSSSTTASVECGPRVIPNEYLAFTWEEVDRSCEIQTDVDGNPTTSRICTEVWDEVYTISVGGTYGWSRLSLVEWDSSDSIVENIQANLDEDSDIGNLIALATGPTWGLILSAVQSQDKLLLFMNPLEGDGGTKVTLYPTIRAVRKADAELDRIDLSDVPDDEIALCLPDAGYTVAEPRKWPRRTTTHWGYTTHTDAVIHHCTGETAE